MAKRIGIFMDVSNLYYCIGKKFQKRKLDYKEYYKFISDLGDIKYAVAYGAQMNNEASGFIHCLKQIGFTPKYKTPKDYHNSENFKRKCDWDVGIAIDIVCMINELDLIVIGSADGDMRPVVDWAKDKGVNIVIIACDISGELKEAANRFIEIPESMLEPVKEKQPTVKGQPDAEEYNGKSRTNSDTQNVEGNNKEG